MVMLVLLFALTKRLLILLCTARLAANPPRFAHALCFPAHQQALKMSPHAEVVQDLWCAGHVATWSAKPFATN